MINMKKVTLKASFSAHQFNELTAPHPLVVQGSKASCNGALLAPRGKVLGYDEDVWAIKTVTGNKEVHDGDWIVEHPLVGVHALTDKEFKANFYSTGSQLLMGGMM